MVFCGLTVAFRHTKNHGQTTKNHGQTTKNHGQTTKKPRSNHKDFKKAKVTDGFWTLPSELRSPKQPDKPKWGVVYCCVVVLWCCAVVVLWRCGVSIPSSPCVRPKRPRVSIQNEPMCTGTTRTCVSTRGRFGRTHGGEGGCHRQFCLPKFAHIGLSRAPEVHKETLESLPISSLREARTKRVPDPFNRPLYLNTLLGSSNPEANFGRNQLLDGWSSLSPLYQSTTNVCHVDVATSLHQSFS